MSTEEAPSGGRSSLHDVPTLLLTGTLSGHVFRFAVVRDCWFSHGTLAEVR